MRDVLLLLGIFALSYAGFALLALSQKKQFGRVSNTSNFRIVSSNFRRMGGYIMLFASLFLALLRDGTSFGSLLWACAVCAGAISVAFTLTYRPRWLRSLLRTSEIDRSLLNRGKS